MTDDLRLYGGFQPGRRDATPDPRTEAGKAAVAAEATWPISQARTLTYVLAVEAELRTKITALSKTSRRDGTPTGKFTLDWLDVLAILDAATEPPTQASDSPEKTT